MKQKTHEEWYVGALQKYQQDDPEWKDRYYNALLWYPGTRLGMRYVRTEEKAKQVLDYAYKLWNGEKFYNENGERYETQRAGYLGVATVSTKEDDERMRIVKHIIKKRTVTEWEIVEEE